jgi:hypothetical protein
MVFLGQKPDLRVEEVLAIADLSTLAFLIYLSLGFKKQDVKRNWLNLEPAENPTHCPLWGADCQHI